MERPSKETLIRYFEGKCLPQEMELVELYLSLGEDEAFIVSCIEETWDRLDSSASSLSDNDKLQAFRKNLDQRKSTLAQLPPLDYPVAAPRKHKGIWIWTRVAAAVLLLLGIGYWGLQLQHNPPDKVAAHAEGEVLPAHRGAFLTLPDGTTVSLADADRGQMATLDRLGIQNTEDGEIIYASKKNLGAGNETYASHTISTPNGGQYRVVLPDGSRAWLNAASTLTYPANFPAGERRVKMTGEVYFEIAAVSTDNDQKVPFYVETARQEIQVLGTHFNVNAYVEEPYITTTLIEGSVRVVSLDNGQSALLRPGQQAKLSDRLYIDETDVSRSIAWKSGDFVFHEEELQSILRKVARWYDVEIDCPAELGKLRFDGVVSRSQPLSTIVDMINITKKANVELRGRRLIVTK